MVINNNTVKSISFMGSGVTSLSYNGVVVWEMEEPTPPLGAYDVRLTLSDSSTSSVTYSNGIIPDEAFSGRTDIVGVEMGSGITEVGFNSFGYCGNLTALTIGSGVTVIGRQAFGSCTGLTSVTIPDSVVTLGQNAFGSCQFSSVTIPNSVTTIGVSCFSFNNDLTAVTIGSGVTSIGDYAFGYDSNLSNVTSLATTAPTVGGGNFNYWSRNGNLYVPTGSDYSTWASQLSTWTITYI